MPAIRLVITSTVKDRAAFADVSQRMLANVKANEPGTTVYNWFVSEDGHAINDDEYTSTEALGAHVGAAQEAGLLDEWMALVDITGVHVLGEVDDAAKEMLEAFGAVHYSLKMGL